MSSWLNTAKNSVSGTNTSKNSSVISNTQKTAVTVGYLLMEDGFLILQEDGYGILLEDATSTTSASVINITKN